MRGPLDRIGSIKAKLGIVIVAAVAMTATLVVLGARTGLPLWLCGVAAVALALAMVQFLARGMTAPLRQMAAVAGDMAEGRPALTIETEARDEVGELAQAFNRMAGELAQVDRERRELIANVSHELRTPISAVRAVLENIVDGVEPADPATLKTMLAQVERLGRLVSQLLDLSRLEAGQAGIEQRSFPLAPLLDAAISEAQIGRRPQDEAAVRLEMSVEPPSLQASGDPERIHQVVSNLLENAIRHSPGGGRVAVGAVERAGGEVELTVMDEGPGIPKGEEDRVFERFYRSDSAHASDGGTGLGLAIARWIVDLHGGRIRAEQRRPRGCRMVVALPRVRR
jgi:signal transduction histidine kinase